MNLKLFIMPMRENMSNIGNFGAAIIESVHQTKPTFKLVGDIDNLKMVRYGRL